ncbi:hypothetical protein, partial [Halosaccharopolyspora lacisalsi]|uniref:hypothetical protein n=1 Tax=Halosaccharopolyspora lacisalsi TaxID=1000566 RepID=UPI001C724177
MTRSPASLAKALDPTYRIRPHTRVISDAFTGLRDHDAGTGGHDRIMCVTPPQIGKSATASMWAVVWWLIHHPQHRVAISSYAASLAIKRGRDIRDTFDEHGHLFGMGVGTPRSAEDWSLTTGGGVRSVGVGGGLTGHSADCVSGSSEITTPAGKLTVEELCQLPQPPQVLSWSHDAHRAEFRSVEATRVIESRPVLDVITAGGRQLRCTPDHLVYVPERGYVPAGELEFGDQIVSASEPHSASRVGDTVSQARRGARERVYDLQVEG